MDARRRPVLLVDDERAVRQVTKRMLEKLGYEVVAVADGLQAVDAFQRHEGAFGVVLLDWTMPGMDGGETSERLRRIRPGVPIVFMSGSTGSEINDHAEDGGARILRKPFSRAALTRTVAALA
jgi:CheY-like chemotaxis protein